LMQINRNLEAWCSILNTTAALFTVQFRTDSIRK
jgi:hypothetical protein